MARAPLPPGTAGKRYRTHKTTRIGADGTPYVSWRAIRYFRYASGETKPIECRGKTEAEAKKRLQARIDELTTNARPTKAAKVKITAASRVEPVAHTYLDKVRRDKRGTTYDRYHSHVHGHIVPQLGQLQLRELDIPTLEDFLEQLAEDGKSSNDGPAPLAANTLRQIRSVLIGVLDLAVRQGALAANPARGLSRIEGGPRKRPRALTGDERYEVLDKLDADPIAVAADLPDLLRFLAGTGVRIGEALGLRWCDLNLSDAPATVHDADAGEAKIPPGSMWVNGNIVEVSGQGLVRNTGKTFAANRMIGLPGWLVMLLALRHQEVVHSGGGPVFPSEAWSWRWPANTRRAIRGFRERAGFEWMTSHTFRRTVATILDELGLTARQIADYLGHARVSMTQDTYMGRGAVDPAAALALDRALGRRARRGDDGAAQPGTGNANPR